MIFSIKTVKNIPTLTITDGSVTCKLILDPKSHHIDIKCEDINNLVKRVNYSYCMCFGKGDVGVAYLKAIKKDLQARKAKEVEDE